MEKLKHDIVSPEMRKRLFANRNGKLLPAQWIDLATEPLVILLLLVVPAMVVFGARLPALLLRSWWVMVLAFLLLVVLPVGLRAMRYARAPIYFARLYGAVAIHSSWLFWRPMQFRSAGDVPVRFGRRLSPRFDLTPDHEYLVYYLDDPAGKVLLSYAPADHEDANLWQPTQYFEQRLARRTGRARNVKERAG